MVQEGKFIVEIGHSPHAPEYYIIPYATKHEAMREAYQACIDYPTLPVFVLSHDKQDGYKYINRDRSYDITGRDWHLPDDECRVLSDDEIEKSNRRKERRNRNIPRIMKKGMIACRRITTHKDGSKDIDMAYYGSFESIRDDRTLYDALSGLLQARTKTNDIGKIANDLEAVYWQTVLKIELFGPNGLYKYVYRNGKSIDEGFSGPDC